MITPLSAISLVPPCQKNDPTTITPEQGRNEENMNDRFQRMSDDGMVLFHADCAGAIYWAYVGSSASSGPFRTFNAALKNYNADTEVAHRKLGDDWSDWSDTSEEGNGQVSELPARRRTGR